MRHVPRLPHKAHRFAGVGIRDNLSKKTGRSKPRVTTSIRRGGRNETFRKPVRCGGIAEHRLRRRRQARRGLVLPRR
jgi:hypothetical protein